MPNLDPVLVVGLGNPGPSYANTRHNVGFAFLDHLWALGSQGVDFSPRFQGLLAKVQCFSHPLFLFKPLSFMNLSGSPTAQVLSFFKIPPHRMVVVFDDLDQPLGAVRMRLGGGHGGHNGVRDLLKHVGNDGFYRIKVGIGKPEHKSATAQWVVGPFKPLESKVLLETSFPLVENRLQDALKAMKLP